MNTAEILNFSREGSRVKADLDGGFSQVAWDLTRELRNIKYHFSPRETALIWALIEKLYGPEKHESLVISDGKLAEWTDMPRQKVQETRAALLKRKILFVAEDGSLGLNRATSQWEAKTNHSTSAHLKKAAPEPVTCTGTGADVTPEPVQNPAPEPVLFDAPEPVQYLDINEDIKNTDISSRPDSGEPEHGKQKKSLLKTHFDAEDMRLAEWMFEQVLKLNPDHKPVKLDRWANTIRLMRERDGKGHRQIAELFKWCNRDSFWHKNILCPDTLRAKWDELVIKSGGVGRINYNTQDFPEEQKPLVEAYKRHCPPKYPAPAAWSPKRGAMITAVLESGLIRDDEWDEFWGWVAQQDIAGAIGFDWFINMDNFLKVFEGTYRAVRGQK